MSSPGVSNLGHFKTCGLQLLEFWELKSISLKMAMVGDPWSSLMKRRARGDMTAVFQYLRGCHKEEAVKLFSKAPEYKKQRMETNQGEKQPRAKLLRRDWSTTCLKWYRASCLSRGWIEGLRASKWFTLPLPISRNRDSFEGHGCPLTNRGCKDNLLKATHLCPKDMQLHTVDLATKTQQLVLALSVVLTRPLWFANPASQKYNTKTGMTSSRGHCSPMAKGSRFPAMGLAIRRWAKCKTADPTIFGGGGGGEGGKQEEEEEQEEGEEGRKRGRKKRRRRKRGGRG
ncbi:Arylsulfatase I, partial [Ophiophagus hannah]